MSVARRRSTSLRRRAWLALHYGHAGQKGMAATELAILLPLLALLLGGAIDLGRAFYAYVAVSSAAHEAAVYAARQPGAEVTPGALSTLVAGEAHGFLTVGPTPTPGGAGAPLVTTGNTRVVGPTLIADATKVPMAQVEVTYNFNPVSPIPLKGPVQVKAVAAAPLPGDVLP